LQLSGQLTALKDANVVETQRGGSIAAMLSATKAELSVTLQSLQDKTAALAGLELRVANLTEDRSVLEVKVETLESQLKDSKDEVCR
jgi:predicted  nucleic acid-binding Zn-ribbon protein